MDGETERRQGFKIGIYITTGDNFRHYSDVWVRQEVVALGSRDDRKRVSIELPPDSTGIMIKKEDGVATYHEFVYGDFKVS